MYMLLKWLHVLAAIVALGANVTYGIWIARASRNPDALPFTLMGIKFIDDGVAKSSLWVTFGHRTPDGVRGPYAADRPAAANGLVSYLVHGQLRYPGRNRLLLGEALGSAGSRTVRLAQGQIRPFMADRADCNGRNDD